MEREAISEVEETQEKGDLQEDEVIIGPKEVQSLEAEAQMVVIKEMSYLQVVSEAEMHQEEEET